MTSYIVDSSAWIEYFDGSEKGAKVQKIIEATDTTLFISAITLSEMVSVSKRKKKSYSPRIHELLSSVAIIKELTVSQAVNSGQIHAEARESNKKISLSDAILVSLSRELNCLIISTDSDFKQFPEAVVLS